MTAKEAVAKRILDLSEERNITINGLAYKAGVSPSTIYSMLNQKSKNPGVVSLHKICDGFDISLKEFFNCDLFANLEQELD
ncbi:MAG: helix-turn-helix transcriptional regulator [Ruminococcaceae bacterium]|nr:helix-turn-helix transcriptional regulator [Oscillospiraceae bacterium]